MSEPIGALLIGGPKAGELVKTTSPRYRMALLEPVSASVRDYMADLPDPSGPIPFKTLDFTLRELAYATGPRDADRYWVLVPEDWSDREAFAHLMRGNPKTHQEPSPGPR